jgi:hypothetical protein
MNTRFIRQLGDTAVAVSLALVLYALCVWLPMLARLISE